MLCDVEIELIEIGEKRSDNEEGLKGLKALFGE